MGEGVKLLYIVIGVVVLIIILALSFVMYKNSYFKSESFRSLGEQSENFVEECEYLKFRIDKLNNSTYADFGPLARQQMEMQAFRTGAIEQNQTLPKYTYFCTSDIFKSIQDNHCKALKDFCGFTATDGVVERLKTMLKMALEIEGDAEKLQKEYEQQVDGVKSKLPTLIKMFAEEEAMFLLGLGSSNRFLDDTYPAYAFKDLSNSSKLETIVLNPSTIRKLSTYLEEHPETKKSSLNFKKDKP